MVFISITLERIEDFPKTEMDLFSLELKKEVEFEIKILNDDKTYRYKTIPYQDRYLVATK